MATIKKITFNRLIAITLILLSCSFTGKSIAQLNIKVGYNLNYSAFSAHNQIISDYNSSSTELTDKFNPLRFTNGLQIGLRFRGEFIGTDLTFERSSAGRSAAITTPEDLIIRQDLGYTMSRVGLGLETYNGVFGIGANLHWEQFSAKSNIENTETDKSVFKDNRLGNRIYLILSAPGTDRISISLQPYISIPLAEYDLSSFSSALGVASADRKEKSLHFGISVVFYNGPQRL